MDKDRILNRDTKSLRGEGWGRGITSYSALFHYLNNVVDKILSFFPKRKTVTKLIKPTRLAIIERNTSQSGRNVDTCRELCPVNPLLPHYVCEHFQSPSRQVQRRDQFELKFWQLYQSYEILQADLLAKTISTRKEEQTGICLHIGKLCLNKFLTNWLLCFP